jgi:Raf kinase inhibitor-like YbhB/YbcL family protein
LPALPVATVVTLAMKLSLTSSAFADGAEIPQRFTCEGENVSPPLAWTGAPPGTRSLALIVDDPDAPDPAAPQRTFVHWVLVDLPPSETGLPEGMRIPPHGARAGLNDWKKPAWGGPCPPIGRHRYFFKLYALDAALGLDRPSKQDVEEAMADHVLAQATLMGTYQKVKS